MVISDKDAFKILGLPLGVDKDAINERYRSMSSKLAASKSPDDKKKLEQVIEAYSQLLPLPPPKVPASKQNNKNTNAKSQQVVYEDDESDDTVSDDDWKVLCNNGDSRSSSKVNQDLTEAEKEKRKERRRAKKKRRKEKKKLGKTENQILNQNSNANKRDEESASEDDDDDDDDEDEDNQEEVQGLDPNSAFFTKAGKKISGHGATPKHEDRRKTLSKGGSQEEQENNSSGIETVVLQSRQLAIRGNEAANIGQYSVAVRLFSDAIRLDPNDHRFFGNRSYCYNQLGQHEKALKDAEKAIKIAPQWPKGHFRKGTSLRGLGRYLDAESAFEEVLRLDKVCQEAREEIKKVRIVRIVEMGFTERQALNAINKYTNVQPALDALLAGEFRELMDEYFFSDEEEELIKNMKMSPSCPDVKMNPKNPEGLTSLWVGNVLPEVTEKMLSQLFAKQGHVTSVRLLKEKYCAFVNYADKVAAGRAMEVLQGYDLCGQKLLIKFPDNPLVNGTQNVVLRKTTKLQNIKNMKVNGGSGAATTTTTTTTSSVQQAQAQVQSQAASQIQCNGAKLKGPVNGDECYFWRTTGCAFGDACKHKHIPKNKGVDRKPWQK